MVRIISAYVATLIAFAILDFLWIGTMANTLYRPVMKDILLADFRLAPAILFYLLYAFGIVLFAILPGLRSEELLRTIALGTALGLVAYGTYDLTNHATLRNWNWTITAIDISWGMLATVGAAAVGYFGAGLAERMLR